MEHRLELLQMEKRIWKLEEELVEVKNSRLSNDNAAESQIMEFLLDIRYEQIELKRNFEEAKTNQTNKDALKENSVSKEMEEIKDSIKNIDKWIQQYVSDSTDFHVILTVIHDMMERFNESVGRVHTSHLEIQERIEAVEEQITKKTSEIGTMLDEIKNSVQKSARCDEKAEQNSEPSHQIPHWQQHVTARARYLEEMDAPVTAVDLENEERGAAGMEGELENFLTGSLEWVRRYVSIVDEQVKTNNGLFLNLDIFKHSIVNTPWTVVPEEYVITCHGCKNYNSLTALREDGKSVRCRCGKLTPIGQPFEGFKWAFFVPCRHFHQIQEGITPKSCFLCGRSYGFYKICEEVGIPKRKIPFEWPSN